MFDRPLTGPMCAPNALSAGVLALVAALWMGPNAATAADRPLPAPEGPVVLTVSGAIGASNTADGTVALDWTLFESLPESTVTTATSWTDSTAFSGILLRDLLTAVDADPNATMLEVVALNDYRAQVPVADVDAWSVLLAARQDGERMRIRDKGPLWVIYPLDDHPDLIGEETDRKMVWQVKEIEVR